MSFQRCHTGNKPTGPVRFDTPFGDGYLKLLGVAKVGIGIRYLLQHFRAGQIKQGAADESWFWPICE